MKLEAVVICESYADFLAETLPMNRILFDKLVVVTSPEDHKTQRICEYWHVKCIQTDSIRSRWKEFCKGSAINEGLADLDKDGWLVHMDADIALPPLTRKLIERADLDPAMVYGCDRFMVRSYKDWRRFKHLPALQQECEAWIHPHAFQLGTRVMSDKMGGYIPIGFFQLWNPSASGISQYPQEHTSAGRGDMLFAEQWPRSKRGFIPEVIGYHLESEKSEMGSNWRGRTTKPFADDGDGDSDGYCDTK
jgi:hypothetical protein